MKKIIPLLLMCFCISLLNCQEAKNEDQFTGSLLWKVSGNGIKKPSYILGTHHLIDISFLDEINGYQQAYEAADAVIGEIDMSNMSELMQQTQQSLIIKEGETGYSDALSEEEMKSLSDKLLEHVGAPLSALNNFKPIAISTVLASKLHQMVDPSFDPQKVLPIDLHIQMEAQKDGKKILGLETAQDQINAMFSDPFEEQLKELICSLDEMDLALTSYRKLVDYYRAGDLLKLYDLMQGNDPDIPQSACPWTDEKKEKMLDNRNRAWIKQLPDLLKANANLIVVGAAHLPGKEGVLYQLAQKGYKVEAVK